MFRGLWDGFFMRIDTFKDFFFFIKKYCEDVFVFVGMIFKRYYKFNYFFVLKGAIGMFLERVKMCGICRYPFLIRL